MTSDRIREDNERMSATLQGWVTDGLFSLAEVRVIAKKRNNFEYIIVGQSDIVDYLRYIKFETELDALLQVRLKRAKKNRDFNNASLTIGRIFYKATERFSNANLYALYINFALQRKFYTTVKKVLAKGIRVFPTIPDMWVIGANFEYDINRNIIAARVLLQMALRYNKASEKVWLTLFTIELKYWRKMMNREKKGNFAPLKPITDNSVDVSGLQTEEKVEQPSKTLFAQGAIPKLVFQNAIKSSDSYEFRAQFLAIACKFHNTEALIALISNNICESFPLNEQALASHADLQFRVLGKYDVKAYESACEVYESAIKQAPKQDALWTHYIQYLLAKLSSVTTEYTAIVDFLTQKLLTICEKAPITPTNYLTWIESLLAIGKAEQASKISNRSIKKFPKSSVLRLQKIEIQIKSGESKGKILKGFERAVKKSEPSAELWSRYVQWMTLNETFDSSSLLSNDDMDTELDIKQTDKAVLSIASRCLKSVFASLKPEEYNILKVNLLNTIFFHFGIQAARTFIQQALLSPPPTLYFLCHALTIEEAQPSDSFSAESTRKLYEEAVRVFGSSLDSEDLWLRYIQFETNQLQIARAGDLYWRAKRTLPDTTSFMSKYDLIKHN